MNIDDEVWLWLLMKKFGQPLSTRRQRQRIWSCKFSPERCDKNRTGVNEIREKEHLVNIFSFFSLSYDMDYTSKVLPHTISAQIFGTYTL